MPILGPEIRRKMPRWFGDHPLPYKVGEEGVVYRNFIAKQWYGSHEKMLAGNPEDGRSLSSPYWGKLKYYEYRLVHRAFPEITLQVVASFDERLTKNTHTNEWDFSYTAGRPVTVSEEVDADPTLLAQRDAIIDPLYESMHQYQRTTGHGRAAQHEQRTEFYRLITEANTRLDELFGEENMTLPLARAPLAGESLPLGQENIMQAVQSGLIADNDHPPVQFLHYGILAIHPHLNFIPTGRDEQGVVKGTYIELSIVNLQQYMSQIVERHGEKALQKALPSLERFERYKALDALYDAVVTPLWLSGSSLINDEAVRNSIFHVCEAVRRKCEASSNSILESVFAEVPQEAIRIILQAGREERAVSELEHLKRLIDTASVERL